jgi:hypothetical protein
MLAFLHQPFPFSSQFKKRLTSALLISLFVFLFLYIFRPFGLSELHSRLLAVTLGYGAVTLVVCLIVTVTLPGLLPGIFSEDKWNVGKEILFLIIIIACVTVGNIFYTASIGIMAITPAVFWRFSIFTLSVGLIPVFAVTLIKQNVLLKKNLNAANKLNNNLSNKVRIRTSDDLPATIHADNPKDNFNGLPVNIYFIKAAENYVEVFYLKNDVIEKQLLRTTLKSAHDDLKKFSQFYRCHRTYIINLEKVRKVAGNAQGYRLELEQIEETIPVSRTLNKDIALRLKR